MSLQAQLQAIYNERGELNPALVVDVARDPTHPLHVRFDWNDSTAAEKYRRQQAHKLIRSVRVTYVSNRTGTPITIRAFHAIQQEDTKAYAYEPTAVVIQDPIAIQLLRAQMQREWAAMQRRYADIEEFWEMVADDAQIAIGS